MSRIAFVVGCDTYDFASSLDGAEVDARRMFDTLTAPEIGNYDPGRSRLLLSPTKAELKQALEYVLYDNDPIEVFTLYFAGHGSEQATGFYMCLRDARLDRLPTSSFWLTEALRDILEARPMHVYLIFDACFSGSLVGDLDVLSRFKDLGKEHSIAISLFASSSRDQPSYEDQGGGFGTRALLSCLNGTAFVQEHSPFLDLTEIGQVVSRMLKHSGQQPCLSVVNVTHKGIFARNAQYERAVAEAFRQWKPRAFLEAIYPSLCVQSDSPNELLSSIDRHFAGLITKADGARDPFKKVEILATAVAGLLPYTNDDGPIDRQVRAYLLDAAISLQAAMRQTVAEMEANPFALLGDCIGLPNLFYLPVRISKVLGWSAAAYSIMDVYGDTESFDATTFQKLLELLIEQYSPSITLMTDAQAPYIATGLLAAAKLGLQDQGEAIFSFYWASIIDIKGQVASARIDMENVPTYILARSVNSFEGQGSNIARPVESVTVFLHLAELFDLVPVVDQSLEALDHISINAYLPDRWTDYARKTIYDGQNRTYRIGHDIWTIAELMNHWPTFVAPESTTVSMAALLCSLLFPDRIPWFLVQSSESA